MKIHLVLFIFALLCYVLTVVNAWYGYTLHRLADMTVLNWFGAIVCFFAASYTLWTAIAACNGRLPVPQCVPVLFNFAF